MVSPSTTFSQPLPAVAMQTDTIHPAMQLDNSELPTASPQLESLQETDIADGTFCPHPPPQSHDLIPRSPSNPLAITMEAITSTAGSRIFLDICAGYQRPLSSSLQKFDCDVCAFDILVHSEDDLLDDNRYELLLRLACSRQVAYSAGSPSCNEYSRLKLRPGGPMALRTPDQLHGIPPTTSNLKFKVVQPCYLESLLV